MNAFKESGESGTRGLSRRQWLCRAGGVVAGALLASLGLTSGRSEASLQGILGLRPVIKQIYPTCYPAFGIRHMLPDDHPVISMRDVIRRSYHP